MKEKLLIFLGIGLLIVILIGLNAASYVQKEKLPDTEINPNRSTFNVGATGTRAFYDLLAETGRKPVRWQKPPSELLNYGIDDPATFVIIGATRLEFSEPEFVSLLRWVSNGGRLVVIDRNPPEELISSTSGWQIKAIHSDQPGIQTNPSDQQQMTAETAAAKPVQTTVLTAQVNAVQPSRFAASVEIEPVRGAVGLNIREKSDVQEPLPEQGPVVVTEVNEGGTPDAPSAPIVRSVTDDQSDDEWNPTTAPVVHIAENDKSLLADFSYGSGQIVFLTDPYIVSNGGIGLVDNSRLAINLVTERGGIIAFDEYHQGFGANNNALISYFEGTPVISFFIQFALLGGLMLLARSLRFARPLPAAEPNRLSKLEYISAMAALQSRTKAFDLAIENVYKEFRRRAAKHVGVDNLTVERSYLAKLISERSGLTADDIDELMFKCEDIIHGEPTNRKEALEIVSRLREIEHELGLLRNKVGRK